MIVRWRPKPLPHRRSATATDPRPLQVESEEHLSRLGRVAGGLRASSTAKIAAFAALQGTLAQGRRAAAGGAASCATRSASSIQGLVLRLALVRPGSARQPDQRQAAAGPDSVRQGRAGLRVVRSRAAEDPARDGAGVDGGELRAGRLSLCDRGSLPPAGARARRQRRAPAVAVEPLLLVAERRLRGALDRRRQVSDRHAVERHGGDADLRPVPRDPRDQPEPGRPRRRVSRVPQALRQRPSTPTPRSTTACCSATGSTPRRAATRRRSMRRCTATTSRPRSSRT